MAWICDVGGSVSLSHLALSRSVLLETDGASEVLAALQVFMLCLAEALEKEHKQVHHTVSCSVPAEEAVVDIWKWVERIFILRNCVLLVLETTHSLTRAGRML